MKHSEKVIARHAGLTLYALRGLVLVLTVAGLMQTEPTLAALELRDINGKPVATGSARATFAYDTVLDATWYLTANNSGLSWDDAMSWAAELAVGTFSGWALPTADPACGDGQAYAFECTNSQMGELWYTELGNAAGGPMSNKGPFKHLESYFYWTGTTFAPDHHHYSWKFYTANGGQRAGATRKAHNLCLGCSSWRCGQGTGTRDGRGAAT